MPVPCYKAKDWPRGPWLVWGHRLSDWKRAPHDDKFPQLINKVTFDSSTKLYCSGRLGWERRH